MKNLLLAILCFGSFVFSVNASEATIWDVNTRAEMLRGEAKGVSVTDTGAIVLSPKMTEVFNAQQSYVWSSAVDNSGNVFLGTGNDGKIFKVDASGKGNLFCDLADLDVSALVVGKDGSLYAGTSPDGKVYRIGASGKAETFFDPDDKYIWSLAVLNDGSLAVGTGENGKIYRVKMANAKPEDSLFFDSSDTHIISLTVDKQGNLIAGTDSNGLVLRISPEGKAFALLDASLREIHTVSVGSDGSIYALALSDSASASKPAATPTPAGDSSAPPPAPDPNDKSRNDLSTAKSAVYRILPDGTSDIIWSSASVTGFSIVANPNGKGVFIGTSDKGRIYSVTNEGRETLLLQSNEGQISTLKTNGSNVFATSSNQGKLYRFGTENMAEGSYESAVRDAKSSASWGRIWWTGNGVELQTRAGNTEKPDETWSDWSAVYRDAKGTAITSPKARFLQWKAVLRNGSSAILNEVNVSYLAKNIAPEILSMQVLPTGIALLGNPPIPTDPNVDNSGIDPTVLGIIAPPMVARKVYQRGAKSLQWSADDKNGDRLEYSVYYQIINGNEWRLLRAGLRDNFLTLDGLSLADGRYVFKVVVNDSPSNAVSQVLSSERLSEPFDVDNSAPNVSVVGTVQVVGDKARVSFDAVDAASFVRKAEFSVDGGAWQTVYADDGISDSPSERFSVEATLSYVGEHTIAVRVFDDNGNTGSARVVVSRK